MAGVLGPVVSPTEIRTAFKNVGRNSKELEAIFDLLPCLKTLCSLVDWSLVIDFTRRICGEVQFYGIS